MKKLVIIMLSFMVITSLSACDTDDRNSPEAPQQPMNTDNDNEGGDQAKNMKINIGSEVFIVSLEDNEAVTAFKKLLPMTVTMTELNNNEKYYDLKSSLPTSPSNPGTIQNGDLMLYGSQTLVLFYKNLSTSYSYTRLGKVDDTTGFISVLGSGNVTVTFELNKNE